MISVCIATYNGEKYIKEQIDSILCQLAEDDEIIVSDDNSTDNTVQILKNYQDSRIHIYTNVEKKGYIHNFEHAIKQAKGDYIFLSDQDDVWISGKVKIIKNLLLQYEAVFSDAVVVNEYLQELHPSFFQQIQAKRGVLKNFYKSRYWGFGLAFRRDLLKYVLPFPDQEEVGHDMIIGFVADIRNSIYFLQQPLTLYRRHSSTVTNICINRKKRSLWKILNGRFIMLFTIVRLYFRIIIRK